MQTTDTLRRSLMDYALAMLEAKCPERLLGFATLGKSTDCAA